MKLNGKNLAQWFKSRQQSDFPGLKADYVARYRDLEDFLLKDVHPLVSAGAAVQDRILLTDHGPYHIATVIQRASELVSGPACKLSAYESYLLLAAIQVHDVGNILGRQGHEAQPRNLKGRLESILGDESVEKRRIFSIAEAHGGSRNGSKDTIRYLVDDPVLNQPVRARFLAALLRFADELADDSQRVSQFAIRNDAIPEASQLPYRYSSSLDSVIVDLKGHSIQLHFNLTKDDIVKQYLKGSSPSYLIDEILSRTLKMHRERVYCMRFLRPYIQIEQIQVKIEIFQSNTSIQTLMSIGYRLEDHGYPADPEGGIYDICPELSTSLEGSQVTGEALKKKLLGG